MQETSFEQMLGETLKNIKVGDTVVGEVLSVSPRQIALNIGYKADGIVTRTDYSNNPELDLTTVAKVGDKMEVKVKKLNDGDGQVVLSRKEIMQELATRKLKEIYNEGGVKKGKVVRVLKGGLLIEIEPDVNVFMPYSLVSDKRESNLDKYLGQELEFYITEFNESKKHCIADRKKYLIEENKKIKEEIFSKLREGDVVEGTVKSITDYGVFVDIGGIDGLVHITEVSWGKIQNPKKVFKVGEKLRVLVREIKDEKISLTLKFPEEDPWRKAKTEFAVDTVVKGKVARITDYGAFIALNEYIDGLLHISEISHKKVKKISDVLSIGQEIEAKVLDIDIGNRRISLSMKALEEVPEEKQKESDDIVDVNIEEYAKKITE